VIKTNLSTRPFYNERAVHLAMILVAVIIAAATAFNVSRILRYSKSDTQLATEASRDEARATDLHQQAARLRASVDPQQVELASVGARQANDLIDRRTFSWTDLLNRFETTLPDEVRITGVRPSVDREKGIVVRVTVVARSVEDVEEFMENLDANGAFPNVLPPQDRPDEDGLLHATLEMGYVPTVDNSAEKGQPTSNAAGAAAAKRPSEEPSATSRGGAPPR
jgi:Tfp pilus assembly protein PilN